MFGGHSYYKFRMDGEPLREVNEETGYEAYPFLITNEGFGFANTDLYKPTGLRADLSIIKFEDLNASDDWAIRWRTSFWVKRIDDEVFFILFRTCAQFCTSVKLGNLNSNFGHTLRDLTSMDVVKESPMTKGTYF